MSDTYVTPSLAGPAIEGLRTATDGAYTAAALPHVDAGNGAGSEALGMLATAVGEFPASFMAQISLLAMAMEMGVEDAIAADRAGADSMRGPR